MTSSLASQSNIFLSKLSLLYLELRNLKCQQYLICARELNSSMIDSVGTGVFKVGSELEHFQA